MVEVDNEPARALYASLGYQEFKGSSWTWKDRTYETLCLEVDIEEKERPKALHT